MDIADVVRKLKEQRRAVDKAISALEAVLDADRSPKRETPTNHPTALEKHLQEAGKVIEFCAPAVRASALKRRNEPAARNYASDIQ